MKKVRLGLVGCGRIAKFHLNSLKDLSSQYEIVAVADSLPERAEEAAGHFGGNTYTSLEALLKNEKVDLITLCTPSGLHLKQATLCADAGVACLTEKPLGCFYEEAEETVRYFEKKNVPFFVVYQNRYNPTVQKVRKWFEDGRFGKLYMVQANVFWQRPQSYYDADSWRGKRHLDGGAFMNQATHYVDLVQWFGGEVETVKSEVSTFERKIESEDTGAALVRFKSGTIGVMAVTMLTYPENQEGSLTFLGENATIKISGKALNKLEVCKGKDPAICDDSGQTNYEPATIYGNGHGEYYKNLLQFLKEPNHPQAITGREGLKSLKIITEIYKERDNAK